ncbi:MAG: hypothetical protein F4W95_01660 [Chloroflexi bacterium]|nr:hypothetical protein [Chloroflexota bacterium]MYD47173.1 hypothetical protein [Chloroflexota bacterium]
MSTTEGSEPPRPAVNPGIRAGLTGEVELTIGSEHLAPHVPKFCTPAMLFLIEQGCYRAVVSLLYPGQTVVGYQFNIRHLASAGIGDRVTTRCTLTDVTYNRLEFSAQVQRDDTILGTAQLYLAVVEQAS